MGSLKHVFGDGQGVVAVYICNPLCTSDSPGEAHDGLKCTPEVQLNVCVMIYLGRDKSLS